MKYTAGAIWPPPWLFVFEKNVGLNRVNKEKYRKYRKNTKFKVTEAR